jgi:hypothetical protein
VNGERAPSLGPTPPRTVQSHRTERAELFGGHVYLTAAEVAQIFQVPVEAVAANFERPESGRPELLLVLVNGVPHLRADDLVDFTRATWHASDVAEALATSVWLTPIQAAARLMERLNYIEDQIEEGNLRGVRVFGYVRIHATEVERFDRSEELARMSPGAVASVTLFDELRSALNRVDRSTLRRTLTGIATQLHAGGDLACAELFEAAAEIVVGSAGRTTLAAAALSVGRTAARRFVRECRTAAVDEQFPAHSLCLIALGRVVELIVELVHEGTAL